MCDAGGASAASRLGGAHGGGSIFVDLDDPAAGVCAAGKAIETPRSPRNDCVRVSAGLDHVTLCNLPVEERVEAVFASASWVDLSHRAKFGKRGPAAPRSRWGVAVLTRNGSLCTMAA
jgi:hypothetical protein